jgi:hypothetical protein
MTKDGFTEADEIKREYTSQYHLVAMANTSWTIVFVFLLLNLK